MKNRIVKEYKKIVKAIYKEKRYWEHRIGEVITFIITCISLCMCCVFTSNLPEPVGQKAETFINGIILSSINNHFNKEWSYVEGMAFCLIVSSIVLAICIILLHIIKNRREEKNIEFERKIRKEVLLNEKKFLQNDYGIETTEQMIELRNVYQKAVDNATNREVFQKTMVTSFLSAVVAALVVKFWDEFGLVLAAAILLLIYVTAAIVFLWWGFLKDIFSKRSKYEMLIDVLDEIILNGNLKRCQNKKSISTKQTYFVKKFLED